MDAAPWSDRTQLVRLHGRRCSEDEDGSDRGSCSILLIEDREGMQSIGHEHILDPLKGDTTICYSHLSFHFI